ncbi:MAG: hypothetical protein V1905_00265, partial [bacterium]
MSQYSGRCTHCSGNWEDVDILGYYGSAVVAPEDSVVVGIYGGDQMVPNGRIIVLRSVRTDIGGNYSFYHFHHIANSNVSLGDSVGRGEIIGYLVSHSDADATHADCHQEIASGQEFTTFAAGNGCVKVHTHVWIFKSLNSNNPDPDPSTVTQVTKRFLSQYCDLQEATPRISL